MAKLELIFFIYRDDGQAEFNVTAPDTITSWVLNSFSVSEGFGLGVSQETQVSESRQASGALFVDLKISGVQSLETYLKGTF